MRISVIVRGDTSASQFGPAPAVSRRSHSREIAVSHDLLEQSTDGNVALSTIERCDPTLGTEHTRGY